MGTILIKPLNDNGSVTVIALLILVILTILGVSSTRTSTIELKIVQNEKLYQKNFYKAEAAVYEAAQRLENESDPDNLRPDLTPLSWLKDDTVDLEDLAVIAVNGNTALVDATNAIYASTAHGIVGGGSLDLTKTSSMYSFEIFGLSQEQNGRVFIRIGYKRRL